MTEACGPAGLPELLEDWITIWQSEAAGRAADREWVEAVQRGADAWAAQARLLAALEAGAREPDGRPGADAPAGATAPAAAPAGGDAGLEQWSDPSPA